MDESAQQAVQLGVNITIFIVALSISITLLIGVRDVATVASEYNASIPSGSRVVSVNEQKKRTISGYELLSYYSNYMTDINRERNNRYVITIEDFGTLEPENEGTFELKHNNNEISLIEYFNLKNIDLNKKYEIITQKYDNENNILNIKLKAIE